MKKTEIQCKRFINLIDIIYENQVSFICEAEAFPGDLHQAKENFLNLRGLYLG